MADKIMHVRDDLLGYVPRAGYSDPRNSFDADGLRVTGTVEPQPPGVAPILAVGDSYTFGEDVTDLEAWPAQLQRLSGRRVLNGGVSGYGFDQIVLRAEQLTPRYEPSVVVVGFNVYAMRSIEMRRLWWHDKPWFAIEHGQLVLKGVPVPHRKLLPLSLRRPVDRFVIHLPAFVQAPLGYNVRVHPAGTALPIACRLIERLAALQAKGPAKVLMLAQYHPMVWIDQNFAKEHRGLTQTLLDCAASNGLAILDSFPRLAAEPRRRELYGPSHMNPRGNVFTARLVAAALRGQ